MVQLRIEPKVWLDTGALSKEGDMLLVEHGDALALISTITGEILYPFPDQEREPFQARFSPGGAYLGLGKRGAVELYSPANLREPLRVFENPMKDQGGGWRHWQISSDDHLLGAIGSLTTGTRQSLEWVSVFDIDQGKEILRLPEARHPIGELSFSSDGRLLAVRPASTAPIIQIWDIVSRRRITRIYRESEIGPVGFLPGTEILAENGSTGMLRLHDPFSGEELKSASVSPGLAADLAFSPLNSVVAPQSWVDYDSGRFSVWDCQTRSVRCFVEEQTHLRERISFSGDGRWLAVESSTVKADGSASLVTIYSVSPSVSETPRGRELQVQLPVATQSERKVVSPAQSSRVPADVAAIPIPTGDGDHCHLYKVPAGLTAEDLRSIDFTATEEEIDEQASRLGVKEFGQFVTKIGEEELTRMVFDIPDTSLKATAAVFYTDESLVTAEGWDSIVLALVAAPQEVENPFMEPGAAIFEGNYTEKTGMVRVRTVVDSREGQFLIGLQCDTTLKEF